MMAMVKSIAEVCGESGRFVHYGATSNDILDTATGLQLKQSLDLIDQKLSGLLAVLLKRSAETKKLVCAGRTHGQIGVPTTYGLRFAIWASETGRHRERLRELRPRVAVGQMTGAVGTQASLGDKGMEGTGDHDEPPRAFRRRCFEPGNITGPLCRVLHVPCKCRNNPRQNRDRDQVPPEN